METKSNDATPLRPDGHRILNDHLVEMNLPQFIAQIKSEKTWQEGEKNSITIFKSDLMKIVLIGLHKNAELKKHTAQAQISVQVLEGEVQFSIEEKQLLLTKGQMISLQPNIPHALYAEKESFVLLTLASIQ
ncbi:MAG: cupin domain-containing protein [Bacteroidetes bacterium]|nr:cupin domain-containing protein [Bacteroidota bacterium]